MSGADDDPADEVRSEYDFRGGERGRYSGRANRDCVMVVLDPDVAAAFPDARAVNQALRDLIAARHAGGKQ